MMLREINKNIQIKIELNITIKYILYNMATYTEGIRLKTERVIMKKDIITMCNLLNSKDEYLNLCKFEPEAITEGGIVFKFNDGFDNKWYKTVRLRVYPGEGKWYWVNENVMSEWCENDDIIFDKNKKFTIFLKSFHGAPLFTLEELKLWEHCFNEIGIIRVGRYPSKKSLIDKEFKNK